MTEPKHNLTDRIRYRPCEYDLTPGPWEPVSGASLAILDLFYDTFKGLGMIGSEFTRLPYVGQTNARSGQPVKTVDLATDSPTTSFSQPVTGACSAQKFIGQRAAKGLYQITKAAARSPMTFTVAMAQGAHNAPRMWGDRTVRPQPKVTGLGTGLMAGCKVSCLLNAHILLLEIDPQFTSVRVLISTDVPQSFPSNNPKCAVRWC